MPTPTGSRLREALQHLAADAAAQERFLRDVGTWPSLDELALGLDDVELTPEARDPPALREAVRRLSEKLDEMSEDRNRSLWEPQAMHRPEWAEVRDLADEALAALG